MEAKAKSPQYIYWCWWWGSWAVAVAFFWSGSKPQSEPQTTAPSYYKVQDLDFVPGATYSPPTSVPYGINDFGQVVGNAAHSSFTYCE